MTYIQIGNIKLQYDESITDIDRIIEIIKLNQYLFIDYNGKIISVGVPASSKNHNIVYISDFDQFFDDHLKRLLKNKEVTSSLNTPDLLPILYIQLLVKKAIQNGDSPIMFDNNISDDMLWFMIACKYFDYETEFSALSEFLKYRKDTERIFDWLKETQRFKTYNYLLEVVTNYLKEYDLSFFEKIEDIILKMHEESMTLARTISKEPSYELPKMSIEDFEEMFLNFLNSIKAPEHWKKIYIKLKNEKRILFEESADGLDHSEVFKDIDGIRKIRVTTDGTIISFVSFVHEFMHYVSLEKGTPPFSLREFPPIYYEKIAAKYLISIGYDEDIIKQVIRDRNQNNFEIYRSLFGLILDICLYKKKGPVTRDSKIAPFKESMDAIYEVRRNIVKICEESGVPLEDPDFLTMPDYNFGEAADKECDENIMRFIKDGLLLLNGYQYLVGSCLVDAMIEKQNDETMLDKMIFITEHLEDFNVEKIMDYIGIRDSFTQKTRKTQ